MAILPLPRAARVAAAALGAIALLAPLALAPYATPPPAAMHPDRDAYLAMAAEPFADTTAVRLAPFCWRFLPPLIVWSTGLQPDAGFAVLTFTSIALLPAVVVALVSRCGGSPVSSVAMGAVAALTPPIVGVIAWSPPMVDAFALLLTSAATYAAVAARARVYFVLLVALAVTKETWLLPATFALIRHWRGDASVRRWTLGATIAAAAAAVTVRLLIVPHNTYDVVELVRTAYWPLDGRTIARRLLLATGATWGVLLPLAAAALVRRRHTLAGPALAVPIAIATAQVAITSDTARPVAAAAPFVLIATALELDRWRPGTRIAAAAAIVLAQVPWLLTFAWVIRLPLRGVEIALVITAIALAIVLWRRSALTLPGRAVDPAAPF